MDPVGHTRQLQNQISPQFIQQNQHWAAKSGNFVYRMVQNIPRIFQHDQSRKP